MLGGGGGGVVNLLQEENIVVGVGIEGAPPLLIEGVCIADMLVDPRVDPPSQPLTTFTASSVCYGTVLLQDCTLLCSSLVSGLSSLPRGLGTVISIWPASTRRQRFPQPVSVMCYSNSCSLVLLSACLLVRLLSIQPSGRSKHAHRLRSTTTKHYAHML